jgi:fructose/tagatose bisphosphate aldolase
MSRLALIILSNDRLVFHQTDEENIAIARPYVERALKLGIAVEVELGRLEGGEAGLRSIANAKLTEPDKAEAFINGFVMIVVSSSNESQLINCSLEL